MAVTEFHCLVSTDDWQIGTGVSSSGTTIDIQEQPDFTFSSQARIFLDTSGIGSDTITAATLHWYNDSASSKSPKAATYDHRIKFQGGATIYQNTAQEAAGWQSHALTAGELASINTSGDTVFDLFMPAPSAGQSRMWTIRAWDHTPTGDYSVYLEVTHAATGGPTKVSTIIGV